MKFARLQDYCQMLHLSQGKEISLNLFYGMAAKSNFKKFELTLKKLKLENSQRWQILSYNWFVKQR